MENNKQVHSVFDEASLKRQRQGEAREAYLQTIDNGVTAAEMTSRYLQVNDMANFEKQAGNKLRLEDFERRIAKLYKNIRYTDRVLDDGTAAFLHMAAGAKVRVMSQLLPDGELKYLCSYPKTEYIPEFTVILQKRVKLPTTMNKVSAKDFPKVIVGEDGTRTFDGDTPFDKYTTEPAGTFPGWRTALARLIGYGLITPLQAEREFRGVDNASWALRTGKQNTADLVQI